MHISSPNPMFDHLLESSCRDDSYKWSHMGFSEEIIKEVLIVVKFMHFIWSSAIASCPISNLVDPRPVHHHGQICYDAIPSTIANSRHISPAGIHTCSH